jgi:hypothetical protein
MSDELDSLRRRIAGFTEAMRLSGPEELIVGNQVTIMRALLFLLNGVDTNGEKGELQNAVRESLTAISDSASEDLNPAGITNM